jgi:hypothetical protein
MERVLDSFSDEEMTRFKGKITTDFDNFDAPPEHAKVVMLDDLVSTGRQMQNSLQHLATSPKYSLYSDKLELQLVVSSEGELDIGFGANERAEDPSSYRTIPTYAYYKAHYAVSAPLGNRTHATGVHSSTDFNFEEPLSHALSDLKREGSIDDLMMPPLTNIIREYRHGEPLVTIQPDGSMQRMKRSPSDTTM